MTSEESNPIEHSPEPHDIDEIPLDEIEGFFDLDEGDRALAQISANVVEASNASVSLSGDDLARARRENEIELAHVEEDLEARLVFLVCQLPDRVWPGKNEEARAISKAATRASDPVCRKLDARRRKLDALSAAYRGEVEAREEIEGQRRAAQKDLELDLTRQDLALRSRFADLDAQLRAAELIVANREASEAQRQREREERVKLVAQYLK